MQPKVNEFVRIKEKRKNFLIKLNKVKSGR